MIFRLAGIVVFTLCLTLFAPSIGRPEENVSRTLLGECVGCRLPADMRGWDLHDTKLVGADARNADFSRANLRHASFVGPQLRGARFDASDLRDASFIGASFDATSFAGAKLEGLRIIGTRIDAATLQTADAHALLYSCTACKLTNVSLANADLRDAQLVGADLSNSDLRGAQLRGASLIAAKLEGAHLEGVDFAGVVLCGWGEEGRIVCADVTRASARGARFDGALRCNTRGDHCVPMQASELYAHLDVQHREARNGLR